MSEIG